jgi:drug/metabolite transporter (DMT)-like permease
VDPAALLFIAVAAVMHATWNILLKTAGDALRTATIGVIAASVIFAPFVVAGWLAAGSQPVPPSVWAVASVSAAVETAYFIFLAAAYRRGDLSVVYPLARGSAPLFAVAVGVIVLGERLVPAAWAGVALLLAGLLVVQRPWLLAGAAARDRAAAGFALLTGMMIATYSALDRVGVQQVPPWLYAGLLWPLTGIGLAVVALARTRVRDGRWAPDPGLPPQLGRSVAAGVLTFTAYLFVLAALARAPLAIVAPLRESAVLLISVWGAVRLREAASRREVAVRVAGSGLVLGGAVVLALAR